MKKVNRILLGFACTVAMISCKMGSPGYQAMQEGFITPPDSMQIGVYWYWVSDNISREGVIMDLRSMKDAGINTAFIGNIWDDRNQVKQGTTPIFSEKWWDILHTALKTASDLDIEIGIFNSPGWSQSGGPWIKPEQSMRYLSSSELEVEGPQILHRRLLAPAENFQDVKVIAYPAPKGLDDVLVERNIYFDPEGRTEIEFDAGRDFTARSLLIRPERRPVKVMAEFEVMNDNGVYVPIRSFEINRSNPGLNVGFDPYAPVVISLGEATGRNFRLILSRSGGDTGIQEVQISSVPRVERYSEKTFTKMYQGHMPAWDAYMWPAPLPVRPDDYFIDPSKVLDITHMMDSDGMLVWQVPPGEWVIQRCAMVPTGVKNAPAAPAATGLEVDKLSRKHVQEHFEAFIGKILDRIPPEDRTTFRVVVMDSYETGGQNFTDGFIDDFKRRFGYDPTPYLPVYEGWIVGDQTASDRFLWDMRRLVADKVAYDYVGGMREIANRNGLRIWLENYGHWGFPAEFLQYGGQSDEISGEFWVENETGNIENRAASSAGHIYGKQRIWAESFTTASKAYSMHPAAMKQRGDRFFAEGINSSLLHVYISQPYRARPGVNTWFGTEFNRHNTWFSHMRMFTDYLKRCNYMLQQGINIADIAYFIGEDAPKMTGIADPPVPEGYQFDYINAEVLMRDAFVRDGKITLPHGTQYRVLVLPPQETMTPELLKKIQELVAEGAVIIGSPPLRSPSLQGQPAADILVSTTAYDMWGDLYGTSSKSITYGKGMIFYETDAGQVLDRIGCVPDFTHTAEQTILYNHRAIDDTDIYFVTNQSDKIVAFDATFRHSEYSPEVWHPVTGEAFIVRNYTRSGKECTVMPMELAPNESVFVVFGNNKLSKAINYPRNNGSGMVLEGPWNVRFDDGRRIIHVVDDRRPGQPQSSQRNQRRQQPEPARQSPGQPPRPETQPGVTFTELKDWSESRDLRIRYYSGTAWYKKSFELENYREGNRVILDLGDLTAMAKVRVNGEYAGGAWTPPYRLDITRFVVEGENLLEVEVVNTWVNRLIWDSRLPERNRSTWLTSDPWRRNAQLQPSGLRGPVTVTVYSRN